MIKYTRQGNDLKNYAKHVGFIDTDQYSKNYFRILDFPDRFYVGKNAFRISGNTERLVKGSKIYIDIVDSNGKIIYHEVLNVVNKDQSRTVVVYVYTDTPTGDATIYVAGRVMFDPRTGVSIPYTDSPADPNYKDVPNIMWIGKSTVVSNKQNNSEVFFTKEPKVYFSETLAEFKDISDSRRSTTLSYVDSGSLLSIQSRTLPKQLSENTSKFVDEYVDGSERLKRIPIVDSDGVVESREAKQLPEFNGLSTLESTADIFTNSMVGGIIQVNNITIDDFRPRDTLDIPTINDYSASIVKVVSPRLVQLDRPFIQKYTYRTTAGDTKDVIFNAFRNQPSWSIEYYDNEKDLIGLQTSESFVNFEFVDLEPAAGTVDRINISYKPIGTIGDFTNLGDYRIKRQNLLVDPNVYELTLDQGLVNRELGYPKRNTDVLRYWMTASYGASTITQFAFSELNISNGIQVNWTNANESSYIAIAPKDEYAITSAKNTEYKLKFSSYIQGNSTWSDPFMDVYISGSSVVSDIIPQRYAPNPIKNIPTLGTYVGTVSGKRGQTQEIEIFFIAKDRKKIKPIFVPRSGNVALGQVSIEARREIGFSPNQAKFKIPLSQLTKSTELIFEFKYLNSDGNEANLDTTVYGLVFTGSDGAEPLPSGLISSSRLDFTEINTGKPRSQLSVYDGGEIVLYSSTQSFTGTPLYATSSVINQQFGSHEITFDGYLGQWTIAGMGANVLIPIMERMDNPNTYYTASSDVAAGIYEINMMLYATTGSYLYPSDQYVWGGRIRGRYVYPYGGTVATYYDAAISNTAFRDDGFSTFGKAGAGLANNFDDALAISATHSMIDGSNNLTVLVQLLGGFVGGTNIYDVYYTGTCKVWKIEYEAIR